MECEKCGQEMGIKEYGNEWHCDDCGHTQEY